MGVGWGSSRVNHDFVAPVPRITIGGFNLLLAASIDRSVAGICICFEIWV